MIRYIRESFRRKMARRVHREYPANIKEYHFEKDGNIQFAEWDNPLAPPFVLNQGTVDFYRKYISEGDLVIDIGANIGDTAVPMAFAAGKSGLTLAFDPNPVVFRILEINSSLNRERTNIVPYRYAITVEEEEFYFVSSEASFANGGISKTMTSRHGRFVFPERVKGINLGDFLNSGYANVLEKLKFIKTDAEGYDKEIIKSVSGLIHKFRPVLVAESFGAASERDKLELYDVIKKHGYRICYFSDFDPAAIITEMKKRDDILKWKETINLLCLPDDQN